MFTASSPSQGEHKKVVEACTEGGGSLTSISPMRLLSSIDSVGGRSTLFESAPTKGCLEREHRVVVCADECPRRYRNASDVVLLTLTKATDYRTLLNLLPQSSAQRSEINRTLRNLEPRIEDQRKKEMGEMMGKLKELGNTFLGALQTGAC